MLHHPRKRPKSNVAAVQEGSDSTPEGAMKAARTQRHGIDVSAGSIMLLGCLQGCHRLGTLVLLLVFLHAATGHSSSNYVCVDGLDSPGATIPKGDILLEKGSSLEIFCNLNITHRAASGWNSSNLVFYRNDKKVAPEFVTVINETTIRLFVKNPPPATAYYYCKLGLPNNNVTGICLNMVAVGFKPQEVKDFHCISQNWQNLTCTWIKPENPIQTTYKLRFYLPGRRGKRMLYNCPDLEAYCKKSKNAAALKALLESLQKNEDMCFWDLETDPHYRQPYEYYYFDMKGYNKLGNVTFPPIKFHHYSDVIPSPPERLITINKTSDSAFLNWSVPHNMAVFPPGVHHRIRYRSTKDDSWQTANSSYLKTNVENHTYHLVDLSFANTLYDVQISLRSALGIGEDKWSPHAFTTFKTSSKLPGAPPETVLGSFEVIPGTVSRGIYVYWQQIEPSLYNGDGFEYEVISVKENGIAKNFTYDKSSAYARFKNLTYNRYEFIIASKNNIGYSVGKSSVYVPSKEDMPREPVSFTKIAFQNDIYELSWKAPPESPDIENYTIFWCSNARDRPYACTGILDWTVVGPHVNMKNITVPDTKIYQFAISANTRNASSGMVWASCTVIHNEVMGKMKSVWINRIGSTFIEVGWRLECSDRIGHMEGFEIKYCPIVSPSDTTCKEPKKKFIESERQFHGNVTGLKPYTTYMVAIVILTNNGKRIDSDPLLNTTMEAAPSAPLDIRVQNITNSSMVVHWSPPAERNGLIRYYEVFCNETERKIDATNNTMLMIDNLVSYTVYKISIVACTKDCSERSSSQTIRTLIGNPGKPDQPYYRFLNASHILVQWKPPVHGGGTLNYYQVSVQQSDGDKNASSYDYNSTDVKSQIPVPECVKEKSHVKYLFLVRAVNIGENGQVYYGPWSEPGQTNCYPSGPTDAVMIAIYSLALLVIIGLSMALVYGGKRLWEMVHAGLHFKVKMPIGLASIPDEKEKNQDLNIDVTWNSGAGDMQLTGKVRPPADEELLLKKKEELHGCMKEECHGDSSGCSSSHESVSSSLTSGTHISSDSGAEVEQRPQSDGIFEESPTPWGGSLRLRKASSSVVRSTPNLSDVEGLSSGQCIGLWTSAADISMPSSEEGASYCRVGVDAFPDSAAESQTSHSQQQQLPSQTHAEKGYVALPPSTSPNGLLRPQTQASAMAGLPPVSRGYVSHQLSWVAESPKKGYVMAGELGNVGGNKMPSASLVVEFEDHGLLGFELLDGDTQRPETYCQLGLSPVQTDEGPSEGETSRVKPSTGYVTLGEASRSAEVNARREQRAVGATGGYVPHRHFEKRNTIPISPSIQEEADEPYTEVFPGETKSSTTNV